MADRNEARILALVAHSRGVSRVDLQASLELPPTTVTSAVSRLLRRGEIIETPDPARRLKSGRRPSLLHLADGQRLLGLVSWSHARTQAVLSDFSGNELHRWRCSGTDEEPVAALMPALERAAEGRMIAVMVSVAQPYHQGVGSPAQRQGGNVPRAGAAWLAQFETDPALAWSQRLGVPVLFENDANLEAVGESRYGAAIGEPNAIYIKLGECSTGAGLVLGGRLYRGANGFAGELAHVHFTDNGNLCACGGRGCLSTKLGSALVESIRGTFGQDVTFADVLSRASAGEPGPARILGDMGRMVGSVIANLVTFLNPSVLVIDGVLGPAARVVIDGLRESIEHYTSPIAASAVRITPGSLGERAELLGAIAVARDEAVSRVTAHRASGG